MFAVNVVLIEKTYQTTVLGGDLVCKKIMIIFLNQCPVFEKFRLCLDTLFSLYKSSKKQYSSHPEILFIADQRSTQRNDNSPSQIFRLTDIQGLSV